MKYEKPEATIVEFETEDVIVASCTEDCGQTSMDAEICDGVTQAVTKPF